MNIRTHLGTALAIAALLCGTGLAPRGHAAPAADDPRAGELRTAVHVSLATRWLDPADNDSVTEFMVLYPLHDALVKLMPEGMKPSLAESWTVSGDGLVYEFKLRPGIVFHNGQPITPEDVAFSFERYRGVGATLLKSKVARVETPAPDRVRFVLTEPWADFMTFYGTTATGAGFVVPKKYLAQVGEEGFAKAPIGAGPYRFVSFTPGVELVLEAFPGYWGQRASVPRLVLRSITDESARAAALMSGEVDIAYYLNGPIAQSVRDTKGLQLVAMRTNTVFFLDFVEQWDAKSPWHDRRVRQAASLAIDRAAINEAESLGYSGITGNVVPQHMEFALPIPADPHDPERAKQLLKEAGYPDGFDAGDFNAYPPYFSLAEAIAADLAAIGIKTRLRSLERAAFLSTWQAKKLRGIVMGNQTAGGNAATRIEGIATKSGLYAYGVLPEVQELFERQNREPDRAKREEMLHQIQRILHDQVVFAPIWENGFIRGVGPRVAEPALALIQAFPYSAPSEALRLKDVAGRP